MRTLVLSFCVLVASMVALCDIQEHGHSYITRNVTIENGSCIFERNPVADGETKALHYPCVIATCYAARREVNATLCRNFGVDPGCRVQWTPVGVYPECCPRQVCDGSDPY
uniref:Single domain-containing protein n=1 Tax=Amblyomma tuberculatum TaxID=48802 RepID=A0A6M2E1N2_9ACAR